MQPPPEYIINWSAQNLHLKFKPCSGKETEETEETEETNKRSETLMVSADTLNELTEQMELNIEQIGIQRDHILCMQSLSTQVEQRQMESLSRQQEMTQSLLQKINKLEDELQRATVWVLDLEENMKKMKAGGWSCFAWCR